MILVDGNGHMMDRRRFGQMLAKLGVDLVCISATDAVFFIIKVTQIADHAAHDIANGKEIGIMGFQGSKNGFCPPAPNTSRITVIDDLNRFHGLLLSSCHSFIPIKGDKADGPRSHKIDKNRIDSLLRPIIYRRRHNFNKQPYQLLITLCFPHAEKASPAALPLGQKQKGRLCKKNRRLSTDTETAALSFIRFGNGTRLMPDSFSKRRVRSRPVSLADRPVSSSLLRVQLLAD